MKITTADDLIEAYTYMCHSPERDDDAGKYERQMDISSPPTLKEAMTVLDLVRAAFVTMALRMGDKPVVLTVSIEPEEADAPTEDDTQTDAAA